jgi:hypothetical protein
MYCFVPGQYERSPDLMELFFGTRSNGFGTASVIEERAIGRGGVVRRVLSLSCCSKLCLLVTERHQIYP